MATSQAEERRQRELGAELAARDSASAELRAALEGDAATLRRAQAALEAERAQQKVRGSWTLFNCLCGHVRLFLGAACIAAKQEW